MEALAWLTNNYIEVFGAVTGIIYVFLEIRQNLWLWPVGIVTSAVYIWVFFTGKLYADMSLQGYYLLISCLGWFWWLRGKGTEPKESRIDNRPLQVSRLKLKTAVILVIVLAVLYFILWFVLSRMTDSPVPEVDSFITSLSIIATWMLARKIYEHWYLWVVVNSVATALFVYRELYPTVILYIVYLVMSFAGLVEWRKSLPSVLISTEK
jgi:nicotinamide mononucleotide transporter